MNDGHLLVAGRDAGGHRDYLDGRPMNAGTALQIWARGLWIGGRYECRFSTGEARFHTYAFDPEGREETVLLINRATMRFRRPPEQDDTLADTVQRQAAQIVQQRQDLRDLRRVAERTLEQAEEYLPEELLEHYAGGLREVMFQADGMLGYR